MIALVAGRTVRSIALILAAIAAPACAAAQVIVVPMWGGGATAPEEMEKRIEFLAKRTNRTFPSAAFYDVAYPSDAAEYDSMAGNALLLLSVLVQDSTKLPVLFVVARADGKVRELQQVRTSLSRRPKRDAIAKVFGPYREDVISLLPIPVSDSGTDLLVYFPDSTGVTAGTASPSVPPFVAEYLKKRASRTTPSDSVMSAFIRREYPGFLAE